jgi:DNA-binding Lrp family transcriptional regulator
MPISQRPRRERVFGEGRAVPLDHAGKTQVMDYAHAHNAEHKRPGQHIGPLTRAYLDVLRALLWGFHNALSGRCYPSYERIAEKAKVSRATVAEAIKALEAAGVLTWVNRIVRLREQGVIVLRRISNAYRFIVRGKAESKNRTGTNNQDSSDTCKAPGTVATAAEVVKEAAPMDRELQRVLARFGNAVADHHGLPP